ncbi:MAG: preprotein translocase subunit SecE [Gammaproteobacteria bacterium]
MDTVLLALAGLVVVASLVAYYYFEATPVVVRALGIVVSLGIGAALLYRTQLGQFLWQFIQGSRVEIRKVVWPTRQETTQTTLAVFFFLLVLGIFFWSLDLVLLMITRAITGQGS